MTRRLFAPVLGATAALWFAAWLAVPWHGTVRVAFIDIVLSVVCFVAAGASFLAARSPENRPCARAFVFLGLGVASWGLGQAAWTWYELGPGVVPSPSVADVGYFFALPLLGAGLFSWPRRRPARRNGELMDAALFVGVSTLFSLEFVLGPIVESGIEGFGGVVLLAYPIGDALLFTALVGGLAMRTWDENGRLLVVAAGILAMVAADTAFAIAGDSYSTGQALDAGWAVAFALVGAAALLPAGWGERLRLPGGVAPLVLIGLLASVFLIHVVEEAATVGRLSFFEHMLTAVLFVSLAIRYLTVAGARQREARRLEALGAELEHQYTVREAALEASRTGVCLFDADGKPVFRNAAWQRLLGPAADDVHGWATQLPEGAPMRYWAGDRYLRVSREGLPTGEALISVDDLTDQERQRATRDRFLAEVMGAQDLEARRIAELLHDDVVQRLTALGMRLELAARRVADPSLSELAPEAGAIVASIRQLLTELHPAVLESQGLSAAVDAASHNLRSVGVSVRVTPFETRLTPEVEHLAYRLVQEALANVLKHAHASHVHVELSTGRGRLRCQVSDDGFGCDPEAAKSAVQRGSLGLHLVRERVDLAGGRFLLDSRPGGGTTFAFELPLGDPSIAAEAAS